MKHKSGGFGELLHGCGTQLLGENFQAADVGQLPADAATNSLSVPSTVHLTAGHPLNPVLATSIVIARPTYS